MNKFENEDKSILDLAQGLASSGQAFAYATVIRTAGATSAKPGAKAIICLLYTSPSPRDIS